VRVLGPSHPDTLVSRMGHALARADSGDPAVAVDHLTSAVVDSEQAHGPLFHMTILIRAHLAWCLADLGQLDAAADSAALAASAAERSFGARHPDAVALREDATWFTGQRDQGTRDQGNRDRGGREQSSWDQDSRMSGLMASDGAAG
jgi:hypothetical protein